MAIFSNSLIIFHCPQKMTMRSDKSFTTWNIPLYINNKQIHSNEVIMCNIIASKKEMLFLFTINYYKHYPIYGKKGWTLSYQ